MNDGIPQGDNIVNISEARKKREAAQRPLKPFPKSLPDDAGLIHDDDFVYTEEGYRQHADRMLAVAERIRAGIPEREVSESDLAMETAAMSHWSPSDITDALLRYERNPSVFTDAKALALARLGMDAYRH